MKPLWLLIAPALVSFGAGWFSAAGQRTGALAPQENRPVTVASAIQTGPSTALSKFRGFCEQASTASATSLPDLWREACAVLEPMRQLQQYAVLCRYQSAAPEGVKSLITDSQEGRDALRLWAMLDPDAAMVWAKAAPDEVRGEATRSVIMGLAVKDPSAALTMALESRLDAFSISWIAERLARLDFSAAVAQASMTWPPNQNVNQSSVWRACGHVMAESELKTALEWARGLPAKGRGAAFTGLAETFQKQNFSAALEIAKESANGSFQLAGEVLRPILLKWGQQDVSAAVMFVYEHATHMGLLAFPLINELMVNWPQPTVSQLVDIFTLKREAGLLSLHAIGIQDYLKTWQPADLAAAMKEAVELPREDESPLRQLMVDRLTSLLQQRSAEVPTELVASLDGADQSGMITAQYQKYFDAGKGRELAEGYAHITDPQERKDCFTLVAENFGIQHPESAAEFMAHVPRDVAKRTALGLVTGLAESDLTIGGKIILQQPIEWQDKLFYTLIKYATANVDSQKSSAYVQQMPTGAAKDSAIAGLVDGIVEKDPASALTWAAATSDPVVRIRNLACTLIQIENDDSTRGLEAYKTMRLTPEERQAVSKRQQELKSPKGGAQN
jgi:hypothetical protein